MTYTNWTLQHMTDYAFDEENGEHPVSVVVARRRRNGRWENASFGGLVEHANQLDNAHWETLDSMGDSLRQAIRETQQILSNKRQREIDPWREGLYKAHARHLEKLKEMYWQVLQWMIDDDYAERIQPDWHDVFKEEMSHA